MLDPAGREGGEVVAEGVGRHDATGLVRQGLAAVLKPGMQELEAMEAPGFWTGFSYGVAVRGTAAPSAVVSIAT
ncbi:hypothetical protein KBY48_27605 [Streptomyces sp. RT42]|nr:hypothetical protein [Streptomyces sp. RT42]